MGCVALTSLIATMELEFLQPNPRVCLDDKPAKKSLFEKLKHLHGLAQIKDLVEINNYNPRFPLDDKLSSMKSFIKTLKYLQAFLQKKPKNGFAIRYLEIKIRDFALQAEDLIETQLSNFLLANNKESQQKASQQLHQILQEAAENAAELLEISKEADEEEVVVVNESEGPLIIPWLKHARANDPISKYPMLEGKMVGRRDDHMLIKGQILRWSGKLRVTSIVGMTGIGKTTLAESVYRDPSVVWHFPVRGWVSMSGEYNKTQMLHHLLWTLAGADDDGIKKGNLINPDDDDDDDVAAKQVYKCLKGKRYLIVLDNLWNNKAWYDIRGCLPDDYNGSHIVITTTHFKQDYLYTTRHFMTLLNPEESWDLFCNTLFLQKHMAPVFEKIRSQVVEKCEGLPHSIVVVAKRLSKCDNVNQEWKKVEKEIELLGVLDRRALALTYNQLPQHLKVCFLYFGVFPKRRAIKVKLLIRLWIVEGFIKPLEGKELEDQAYEYLQELIDRSLILIDSWGSGEKIKNCRMHSALHSFCVREAQKEGIFCALNTQQLPRGSFSMFANSCRWLSLYTHKFDYYVLLRTNNPRSIFFFQEDAEIFVSFKLLRVLAFVPSSFLTRAPTRLQDLVFLRYLSVTEWFEGLEYVVLANQNLQTLVVSSKQSQLGTPTIHLPCTIWESPRLQHLELDKSYVIDPPSMDKDNMQTLSWVCPTHCKTGVYCRFPNIEKLKALVFCNNPIIWDNLEHLERLERLSISVSFGCLVTLPMFPPQLKKLTLNDANLSESDLKVIGMLPQLEVLKLENAFSGEVWEVKEGFYGLKFLLLEDKMLKRWTASEGSFPCLKYLVLRFCYCLKKIPRVMEDIRTLKSIELQQCCPSVISSAKCILEHQRDVIRNDILEVRT